MNSYPLRSIASAFRPSRFHYFYAWCKLRSDPAYAATSTVLAGTSTPILDVGCGIGLLAHYLRAMGIGASYMGVDNDELKLASARLAARVSALRDCEFVAGNLEQGLPRHQGHVVILDVLHYLPPQSQQLLLREAAACLDVQSLLIIRSGLHDAGWRSKITHAADALAHMIRWMNSPPTQYPDREPLQRQLAELGLQATFRPLWGRPVQQLADRRIAQTVILCAPRA